MERPAKSRRMAPLSKPVRWSDIVPDGHAEGPAHQLRPLTNCIGGGAGAGPRGLLRASPRAGRDHAWTLGHGTRGRSCGNTRN